LLPLISLERFLTAHHFIPGRGTSLLFSCAVHLSAERFVQVQEAVLTCQWDAPPDLVSLSSVPPSFSSVFN